MATSTSTTNFDEVKVDILRKLEGNQFYADVQRHLEEIESHPAKGDASKAERWISWARQEKNLKVIGASIPSGILPGGQEGELFDVKVFTRFGPDDPIYDNNKAIRDRVARGNSFLQLSDNSKFGMKCVLQAMKKFTGGLGDDDDRESGDDAVWQRYFSQPIEATDIVVTTKKANGEAAHLSCVPLDGQLLLCGGSKNVHLIFRDKEDIEKYVEPRYRIAREVCETVMGFLDSIDPQDKHRLLTFLAVSQYTAVFEILSPFHQHVVDLSSLKSPELQFITWTKCELEPSEELKHLNIIPPSVGIELARTKIPESLLYPALALASCTRLKFAFKVLIMPDGEQILFQIARALGLQAVDYDVISMEKINERMKEIRQGYQFEGEVLYFLDKSRCVIGLLKKKTVWYIICRAVREKLKAACSASEKKPETFSMSKSIHKLEKRIREIQSWLSLDHETTEAWRELSVKCMKWTIKELGNGCISLEDVQDQFPTVWRKFLEASGETDHILAQIVEGSTGVQSAGATGSGS